MTKKTGTILAAAMVAAAFTIAAHAQSSKDSPHPAKNVVLVHGAFADGSGWRGSMTN